MHVSDIGISLLAIFANQTVGWLLHLRETRRVQANQDEQIALLRTLCALQRDTIEAHGISATNSVG